MLFISILRWGRGSTTGRQRPLCSRRWSSSSHQSRTSLRTLRTRHGHQQAGRDDQIAQGGAHAGRERGDLSQHGGHDGRRRRERGQRVNMNIAVSSRSLPRSGTSAHLAPRLMASPRSFMTNLPNVHRIYLQKDIYVSVSPQRRVRCRRRFRPAGLRPPIFHRHRHRRRGRPLPGFAFRQHSINPLTSDLISASLTPVVAREHPGANFLAPASRCCAPALVHPPQLSRERTSAAGDFGSPPKPPPFSAGLGAGHRREHARAGSSSSSSSSSEDASSIDSTRTAIFAGHGLPRSLGSTTMTASATSSVVANSHTRAGS